MRSNLPNLSNAGEKKPGTRPGKTPPMALGFGLRPARQAQGQHFPRIGRHCPQWGAKQRRSGQVKASHTRAVDCRLQGFGGVFQPDNSNARQPPVIHEPKQMRQPVGSPVLAGRCRCVDCGQVVGRLGLRNEQRQRFGVKVRRGYGVHVYSSIVPCLLLCCIQKYEK